MITVIDDRMGASKTSAMIQFMNTNKSSKKFIFVTPFLDEVQRIKDYCGFEVSKSMPQIEQYSDSDSYFKLLSKFLSDLNPKNIKTQENFHKGEQAYIKYSLLGFCALLFFLYITKSKKRKDKLAEIFKKYKNNFIVDMYRSVINIQKNRFNYIKIDSKNNRQKFQRQLKILKF
jgi:hypothetical protein